MAPKPTAAEIARSHRDARAKKLLLVLLPLLVILAVWQGPKVWDQLSSATEATKSTTEDVQGKVVQGFAELAPNGTATTAGEAPTEPAELVAAGALQDTDPAPKATEGELITFTRFTARDPFVQLVDDEATSESSEESSSSASSSSGSSTSGSTSSSTTTTTIPDDTSGATQTQATIRVNGIVVTVSIGETFPASDPAFILVGIDGGVAQIGLVSGTFSSGVQTLDLEVGDSVTLISQPDGARFTLKLIELG